VYHLRPEHLQSFWYFASKTNLAIIGTFGCLMWATARDAAEKEYFKTKLGEYKWTLRVSSKGVEFMEYAMGVIDASVALLSEQREKAAKDEEKDARLPVRVQQAQHSPFVAHPDFGVGQGQGHGQGQGQQLPGDGVANGNGNGNGHINNNYENLGVYAQQQQQQQQQHQADMQALSDTASASMDEGYEPDSHGHGHGHAHMGFEDPGNAAFADAGYAFEPGVEGYWLSDVGAFP
jgi:hypothetical protein